MTRDSAIVIFCSVTLLAVLFWKIVPSGGVASVVTPEPEDTVKPVNIAGPGMKRPSQFYAQPYLLMPPVIPYVENRGSYDGK